MIKMPGNMDHAAISYKVQMPLHPRPIAIIGAGGIVGDAHLPAYHKAGWEVAGIYDPARDKAKKLAAQFNITRVYDGLQQMITGVPADTACSRRDPRRHGCPSR